MFKPYTKTTLTDIRPYVEGEDMAAIGVSDEAKSVGSPKIGDMICKDPPNPEDVWLITEEYFKKNYQESAQVSHVC